MYACMYVCMYVKLNQQICMYLYMYVCPYACMCVCIFIHIYLCIYVYIYKCVRLKSCMYLFSNAYVRVRTFYVCTYAHPRAHLYGVCCGLVEVLTKLARDHSNLISFENLKWSMCMCECILPGTLSEINGCAYVHTYSVRTWTLIREYIHACFQSYT